MPSGLAIDIGDHVVQFYEDDAELITTVTDYVIAALRANEVAVVVATAAHRRAVEVEIEAAGVGASGSLIVLDAADTLAQFMTDDGPDRDAFAAAIGGALRAAGANGQRVRAYGEMVALLWEAGDVIGALKVEGLWNDLSGEFAFSLLCAYPSDCVSHPDDADALRAVCHLHSAVVEPRPTATRDFPAALSAPGLARRFVEDALRRRGYEGRVVDDAALVITEMATNAVIHERSPFTVRAESVAGVLRVSVQDRSSAMPAVRQPDTFDEGGRGLRLVAAVAAHWGVERTARGKIVWAELHTY